MKNILILCTGNSCRSQIAHGFLNHLTDNSVSVFSAGIEKHGLNRNAVKCMADFVITVCDNANETCPILPNSNAKKIHKNFEDPSKLNNGQYGVEFIEIRDQINKFIIDFIKTELI